MKVDSISALVRPNDVSSFFHDVWGRVIRYYPQSLGEEAGAILNLKTFELILASLNRAHEGWLHFARGGLKPVPPVSVDQDGMLDLTKIRSAFSNGETLYLTKAERLSASLMYLCRAIEINLLEQGIGLRKSVNAHVFLTPPNSQGFTAHRDEHASFVLQLEGAKEWTVYEEDLRANVAEQEMLAPGSVDRSLLRRVKKHTHFLHAGDVLYMPEWWPHEARSSSSHSLHVTLRIFPLRWVDVLMELCGDHPVLCKSVPRHFATKPAEIVGPLVNILGSQAFLGPLPSLLELILRRHIVPGTVLPDDGFRQSIMVDQVDLDTTLVRPAGSISTVYEMGDDVCIRFPGGVIRGPSMVKGIFEHVARSTVLRARDLPAIAGGHYDRVDIVRTMVRDGLLRIADDKLQRHDGRQM